MPKRPKDAFTAMKEAPRQSNRLTFRLSRCTELDYAARQSWNEAAMHQLSSSTIPATNDVCVGANSTHLLEMCGPYRRTTREEELARIYSIPIPKQPDLPVSYNIAPSQNVLAIRFDPETRERTLDQLRWGLIPPWAKDQKSAYRIQGRDGLA
jgi:SOS response associated peptidase (SRAP)